MRAEGMRDHEILRAFEGYRRDTTRAFYRRKRAEGTQIDFKGVVTRIVDIHEDSRSELILYEMLKSANIPFEFQYKIGHYRVDYLIDGRIVLECDGPQHGNRREKDRKRDQYLERLGYDVIRLSWSLIAQIPDVLISEIKALIMENDQ